jgi:hypothetical protein
MVRAPIALRDKRGLYKWFRVPGSRTSREPWSLAAGSQLLEGSPAPESQDGINSATAPQHREAFLDPGSHEPSGSEPIEVDELDPREALHRLALCVLCQQGPP